MRDLKTHTTLNNVWHPFKVPNGLSAGSERDAVDRGESAGRGGRGSGGCGCVCVGGGGGGGRRLGDRVGKGGKGVTRHTSPFTSTGI